MDNALHQAQHVDLRPEIVVPVRAPQAIAPAPVVRDEVAPAVVPAREQVARQAERERVCGDDPATLYGPPGPPPRPDPHTQLRDHVIYFNYVPQTMLDFMYFHFTVPE